MRACFSPRRPSRAPRPGRGPGRDPGRGPRRAAVVALLAGGLLAAWAGGPATARGAVLQGENGYATGVPGQFGAAVSELEDLNGDGRWELLIGAPGADAGGTDNGRVYLWFGGTNVTYLPARVYTGQNNEQFGFAVARIGDVNDDGRPDFAVGAPLSDASGADRGRVYIFFGRANPSTTPDVTIDSPSATQTPQFGFSVSAAGDFNGDGVDDFVVGAPYADNAGLDAGAAYVFYGSTSPSALAAADLILLGTRANERFGWAVSDGGDFYDDGRASIVVGAPANAAGLTMAGAAYVFRGSASPSPGPDATADLTLTSSSASGNPTAFGAAVRGVGDWDGDGDDEIAVGAPWDNSAGADAGRVEIFFGAGAPSATAARYANGEDGDDLFGSSLADVGDVVGTSRVDLLVGAPGQSSDGAGAGRAYLWAGGGASTNDAGNLVVVPAAGLGAGAAVAGDEFGFAVSAAGDFDGDGKSDYAVGAPLGNIASDATAGIVPLYDSSGGVVPTLLQAWSATWSETGAARLSFRLGEPPDAFAWLALWRLVAVGGEAAGPAALVCEGPPGSAALPLQIRGETWILLDHPEGLPDGAVLSYSLVLTTVSGAEMRLEHLAGPPPAPALARIELRPPQPNPFNPRTVISFRAPAGAAAACRIVDLRGRLVATVFEGSATGSWQTAVWDGTAAGRSMPAGIYTVQLAAGGQIQSRRVVLAK